MPTSTKPQDHIPALDGLRGLAILLILVDHLMWSNFATGSRLFDFLAQVRESSWIGVNLFFALSGFLITGILLGTLGSTTYFRTFYARRTVRIFPLYYGVLFLLFALTKPLHFHWNGWQWYELTYTQNLALWRWSAPLVLHWVNITHFWSLNIEEQFYLVWPFIVYRLRDARRLITLSLFLCLATLALRIWLLSMAGRPHFTNPFLAYSFTPANSDTLLFGCTLALLIRTPVRKRVLAAAPAVFTVCALAILAFFFKDHGLDPMKLLMGSLGVTILGIAATALIAMALTPASRTASIFSHPFLRFFGRYSYGLYVFHFSLAALNPPIRLWIAAHTHSKAAAVAGSFLIITGLAVVVALLSYHLYEVHFLRLKKFFPNAGAQSPAALTR